VFIKPDPPWRSIWIQPDSQREEPGIFPVELGKRSSPWAKLCETDPAPPLSQQVVCSELGPYGRYSLGSGAVADSACNMMPVTRQPPASLIASMLLMPRADLLPR